ncbi:MAG: ferritin-like domain-containing protein [Candidatus Bathyarchaeota archaeon]|nr:ferritin-like domain-containing protein [Candidatus Bathyarchaeota archaeon]
MQKSNDPQVIANLINCLSILENNTFELYTNLAEKIGLPIVKSIFIHIAIDSHKHSMALKCVAEKIGKPHKNPKNCEKHVGEVWRTIERISREITRKARINQADWPDLLEKLAALESVVGEEYYMLVELKTLQMMAKEINQMHRVDLSNFESIFLRIIQEEETHRALIEKVKRTLVKSKDKKQRAPIVKYQQPDSWNKPMPPTL